MGDMYIRYGLPFIDHTNGGSLDGMIDVLWDVATLINDDTIVIPGHGQLSSRGELLDYRNMLVTIRGKLLRAKSQNMTAAQMLATEPADSFAEANDYTNEWLTRAYGEFD